MKTYLLPSSWFMLGWQAISSIGLILVCWVIGLSTKAPIPSLVGCTLILIPLLLVALKAMHTSEVRKNLTWPSRSDIILTILAVIAYYAVTAPAIINRPELFPNRNVVWALVGPLIAPFILGIVRASKQSNSALK